MKTCDSNTPVWRLDDWIKLCDPFEHHARLNRDVMLGQAFSCIFVHLVGFHSSQGKTMLIAIIFVLGVLSGQDKTTLTVYIFVLGIHLGQGKRTLSVYILC